MSNYTTTLAIAALLGSGVIGGVFFAFSSFIMKSLARLPYAEGIAAMQSVNEVVINRSFLGTFMGTAVICLLLAMLSLMQWSAAGSVYFLAGAALYFVGTFVVTLAGNVPLNNRLAAAPAHDESSASVWEHYLERWTRWNTIRSIAAVAATVAFLVGLMTSAGV